jgi:DNA-binding ferritin-like protein (Dps family)
MLVKYSTFAEQFAIDEDFMEIMTNIIIQDLFRRNFSGTFDTLLLLFTLCQHKNVRNIFYQNYTKISMKNILKQISLSLIHEMKLVQSMNETWSWHGLFRILNLSLQYEDMLAMQIIDKGGDDIVLGIFHYFFTIGQIDYKNIELLFSILEGFAKQKEGEAIIIKHVHLLVRVCVPAYDGVSKLVRHKGIAQALITQEGVELLVGALERRKIDVVPPVLKCLFFENEKFAYKVIARGGWRMITKGMQLMTSRGMFQFSLMHIAKEMASKGEIQEVEMEVINGNDSEHYCLQLLKNLITDHMDIMREEFIAKGAIRFLLASLASLNHWKKFKIITSGLLQRLALDKGVKEMLAHTGIQMLVQLLVPRPNDNNDMNNWYVKAIVNIIELSIEGLEDPMKLLKSSIDDIDVLKMHNTLLRQYHSVTLLFFPQTLDVDINIAKEWLNSLGPPFNASNMSSCLHKDDYEGDYKNYIHVVFNLNLLSKHIDIASMIMANEGILERFLIQLSEGNLDYVAFQLLKVVLQHERVATDVVHQRPSFIKELLQLFLIKGPNFVNDRRHNVASLLLVLAKHGGVFIKFIVNSGGIQIFLQASLENWIGHCDVIEVLGIMAKDEDHALQIEKAGGSKMLLRAISCYLQYVHDIHLKKTMTIYKESIMEYEDDHLVMCCLKTLSLLVNHEEVAKQILTRRGDSKEWGIITLVDVMQTASQLWSSITLTLRENVVNKKLMQIKGLMLTILSNVASTLALMAKLHPHINISRNMNEDVFKGIFQLEGMVIDEHQTLKGALQDLLNIKKFHTKTWNCQQLRSKTIDVRSYEGMVF